MKWRIPGSPACTTASVSPRGALCSRRGGSAQSCGSTPGRARRSRSDGPGCCRKVDGPCHHDRGADATVAVHHNGSVLHQHVLETVVCRSGRDESSTALARRWSMNVNAGKVSMRGVVRASVVAVMVCGSASAGGDQAKSSSHGAFERLKSLKGKWEYRLK